MERIEIFISLPQLVDFMAYPEKNLFVCTQVCVCVRVFTGVHVCVYEIVWAREANAPSPAFAPSHCVCVCVCVHMCMLGQSPQSDFILGGRGGPDGAWLELRPEPEHRVHSCLHTVWKHAEPQDYQQQWGGGHRWVGRRGNGDEVHFEWREERASSWICFTRSNYNEAVVLFQLCVARLSASRTIWAAWKLCYREVGTLWWFKGQVLTEFST